MYKKIGSKEFRFHVCLLDRVCWIEWWELGAPMRIHVNKKFWTVLHANWISKRRWDWDHASTRGDGYRCLKTGITFDDPRFPPGEQFARHLATCQRPHDWLDWVLDLKRFKHPNE